MDMQAGPRKQAPLSAEARRGHLAMLAFSALVAGSFSLGAMVAPLVDPAALTALRFALAAAVVGLVAALGPGLRAEQFRAPWRHVVLGFLMALYFVLMFEGLKTATAVSTAAVFTLTPLMAAGFGWVLLRQGLTGRMALALSIGALGAVWVIFRGDPAALAAFEVGRGEAVFFVGCVAHAFYAPLVRKLNRGEPALSLSFGMMVAGCAMLTLWAWAAIRATDWAGLPAIVWITLVYIAVAASAASFVLLQYAALRLPASKVMAYTYLTPAWVILWEIALLRGAPPPVVLGGVVLTVLALWMLLKD
ncbi:MAG: DMT family transporter [Pseudorhodobacter sp.]